MMRNPISHHPLWFSKRIAEERAHQGCSLSKPSWFVTVAPPSLPVCWRSRVICHNSKAGSSFLTLELKRKFKSPPLGPTLSSWRRHSWDPRVLGDLSGVAPCVGLKIRPRIPGSQAGCESVSLSIRWGSCGRDPIPQTPPLPCTPGLYLSSRFSLSCVRWPPSPSVHSLSACFPLGQLGSCLLVKSFLIRQTVPPFNLCLAVNTFLFHNMCFLSHLLVVNLSSDSFQTHQLLTCASKG